MTGTMEYLWYSPEYPLGLLYPYPQGGSTLYLDTLKPLPEPVTIAADVTLPPEYDEAIKYGLAVRLAPEYGRPLDPLIVSLAKSALDDIENKNFAEQINAVKLDIINISERYNIDEG